MSELERYSFTKLSSFHQCPYGYKLRYIDHNAGEGNAFSSYGSEIHSLLERYAKGEIDLWDLPHVYEWEFDSAVPEKFPYNKFTDLRESYYQQGLNFLNSFQGYDGCQILGIEQEFEIPIDDWIFNGFIDLIIRDKDGTLILQDYKSKAKFKSAKEKHDYARQLYLYSMYVKEKFGVYPDKMRFLMFRSQKDEDIDFNIADLDEAIQWAKQTVKDIRECWVFLPKCESFYGNNLCNHRGYCEFKAD